MAVNFTLKEPLQGGYQPPKPFGLYVEGSPPHEVLRLLLGSVNLEEKSSGKILILNKNEYRQTARRMCRPERISHFLFEGAATVGEYEHFIKALSSNNQDFFERLRHELTLALAAKRLARYTESFLYLYRILEMISVAFPLLYASTQTDFKRSHDFLKSLMENERDGDLAVLNKAVPFISKHGSISRLQFDFSIEGLDVKWVAALKKQMESAQIQNTKGFEFEPTNEALFRVPFNSMSSLIVQFRNRMFHYRPSEPNFDLGMLGGSEPLCKMLVEEMSYWFALIYAELLRVMATRQF